MKRVSFIVIVGLMIYNCGTKDQTESDEISGAYVREYSFKVTNPESGAEVGMRTVRDTILIKRIVEEFEVSNHKWALNDYDKEGWRNMEHAEDRSLPIFHTTFDSKDNALEPSTPELFPQLIFDQGFSRLYRSQDKKKAYQKVQ